MTIFDMPTDSKYGNRVYVEFPNEMNEPVYTLENLQERLKKFESDLLWMTCPAQGQRKAYYEETIPVRKLIKMTKKDIKRFIKKEK